MVEQRTIYAALVAATVVFGGLLFRHFTAPEPEDLNFPPVDIHIIEPNKAVERFAGILRFKTVSNLEAVNHASEPKEFEKQLKYIRSSWPIVYKKLEVREVNKYSLLVKWQGRDRSLKPILCVSHLDVVAVGPEEDWEHPPFSGAIADGYVWGRGAQDVKGTAAALLEAVSQKLQKGFIPERTLYLAFGHDEEVHGTEGAGRIADLLKEEGVALEYILDEGGFVLVDGMKGIVSKPLALVGSAEKGLQNYEVEVYGKGGHSMVPPTDGSSAVSRLTRIIQRLDKHLPKPRIESPTRELLHSLGEAADKPVVGGLLRSSSWWPISYVLAYVLSRVEGDLSACVRTTAVVTDIQVFPQGKNVVPSLAKANFNFRILPGEEPDVALKYLENLVRGERKGGEIKIVNQGSIPLLPRSDLKSAAFKTLRQAAIETLQTEKGLVVTPYLMLGRTDSTQYVRAGLVHDVFRFAPFPINRTAGDVKRIHGIDERLSAEGYVEGVKFFVRFLQLAL